MKIEPNKNEHRFLLSPGDYFLTVKKSGLTKTIKAVVETSKSTQVLVGFNKDNNSLELELQ